MTFRDYLQNLPLLHSWDGGRTWNAGGFHAKQLDRFHRRAGGDRGGLSIIETGAGNSTLAFLQTSPSRLVSIAPEAALFERIRGFCDRCGIDAGPLRERVERSELALPIVAAEEGAAGGRFDIGLLDGGHGWPTVFVDFCYVNMLLKSGGILWVDDVQLHSVKELVRFLVKQPEFRLVEDLGKVLAFEKLTDAPLLGDFGSQPYIAEQTSRYAESEDKFAL